VYRHLNRRTGAYPR